MPKKTLLDGGCSWGSLWERPCCSTRQGVLTEPPAHSPGSLPAPTSSQISEKYGQKGQLMDNSGPNLRLRIGRRRRKEPPAASRLKPRRQAARCQRTIIVGCTSSS